MTLEPRLCLQVLNHSHVIGHKDIIVSGDNLSSWRRDRGSRRNGNDFG